MSIVIHIPFYFMESRKQYVNRIIGETNTYGLNTDIFIHTNTPSLSLNDFDSYKNGTLRFVYHDLKGTDPFYLTWKCRDLMKAQADDYDIFMYLEDDILVPWKALQYWNRYFREVLPLGYNLGFMRIEVVNGIEYLSDLSDEQLEKTIQINGKPFCVNDKNPYCAFWIYAQHEFKRFVSSRYYDPNAIGGYGIREKSAIGLHGVLTKWYKSTVIPIEQNRLIDDCKIYHMPNNYALDPSSPYGKLEFTKAIKYS
jgi:hypothetical protein